MFENHFLTDPVTEIVGGPDIYVDRGSTLNVTCAVASGAKEPEFIYWSHNNQVIDQKLYQDFEVFFDAIPFSDCAVRRHRDV